MHSERVLLEASRWRPPSPSIVFWGVGVLFALEGINRPQVTLSVASLQEASVFGLQQVALWLWLFTQVQIQSGVAKYRCLEMVGPFWVALKESRKRTQPFWGSILRHPNYHSGKSSAPPKNACPWGCRKTGAFASEQIPNRSPWPDLPSPQGVERPCPKQSLRLFQIPPGSARSLRAPLAPK